MARVPLTILNGFLGAGKTTLLKSLLKQAHQQQLSMCVIVNDMSELDVDGVLIANTDIVGAEKHNFVTISADSISSSSGIQKLDSALCQLLSRQRPAHILLETSGSSHPLPLVKYLRDHPQVVLKGLLTLVDAVMLRDDFDGGERLLDSWQENLRQGRRGTENLLAEQVLFCSHLLLTKNDRLPFHQITEMAKCLHTINPYVSVKAVAWGNLQLAEMLAMPDYAFHRVATLIDELEAEVETVTGQTYNIESRVLKDDRPFHPQRLWDTYHQFLGAGIHRSKGFFWLPGRDDLALLWNQAAGSISLEFVSYWKAGVLTHDEPLLTQQERETLRQQLRRQWPGRFGDRRCRLTVIGQLSELDRFVEALKRCFLTEGEIRHWAEGGTFVDPWPRRVARRGNV
ncbi:cobalamin biosynthesis protein CobW [Erwinia typographi]|uniref:Cobalamin biosynthesis protein CobW n=1 Tax=Erwinia typographi TaxID=371042 RepID=A0A0A3YMK4_9GAMM|nr:GTP-binding protein [Erwinia typographi]KGT86541.1 cobalamin biosynthesis protein CobW [Erwinia typographi]